MCVTILVQKRHLVLSHMSVSSKPFLSHSISTGSQSSWNLFRGDGSRGGGMGIKVCPNRDMPGFEWGERRYTKFEVNRTNVKRVILPTGPSVSSSELTLDVTRVDTGEPLHRLEVRTPRVRVVTGPHGEGLHRL